MQRSFLSSSATFLVAVLAIGTAANVRAADEEEHSSVQASGDHAGAHGTAAEHDEDSGAHADDAHGDIDTSVPPLEPKLPLVLFSLVTFGVFLLLAKKFAWLPLIEGLDSREARVNRALAQAEEARIGAERLLADHQKRMEQVTEEVRGIVATARVDAEREKARVIAEADREASTLRDEALADIQAARQAALSDLDGYIDSQAGMAMEHILQPRT